MIYNNIIKNNTVWYCTYLIMLSQTRKDSHFCIYECYVCEQERVIHECMKMWEVKLRGKRMIRLESVHAKETTVWVYKMKSIFQVSILIAIALVCGSTFTMAGEPLSMDQLVDHLAHPTLPTAVLTNVECIS